MMPMGTTLSRWTMSYFGAALSFLLLAEIMLSAGWWAPSSDLAEPTTLIIVHSMTIGWLGLLMIGALLQFTPVLTGLGLPTERFSAPCLAGSIAGLLLLLLGFYLIDLGSDMAGPIMIAASTTLVVSLLSIGLVLSFSLWRGRRAHVASGLVLIGIACLAITVGLGALFATTISGAVSAVRAIEFVTSAVPYHAGFGLVGWMTFAAIGVSYKLLPMFLLSDDMENSSLIRASGLLTVIALAVGTPCTILHPAWGPGLSIAGALMFTLTVTAYLFELFKVYRARRRKALELNTLGSLPAFGLLGAAAVAFVLALVLHAGSQIMAAITYLFVFGWLTGFGLAQLLKIVPFLTWIEAFGPLLGRRPTPRLAELIKSGRATIWLGFFYIAVVTAAVTIAIDANRGFHTAVIVQTMATAALAIELLLARSLANIAPSAKGAPFQQPALFVATTSNRGNAHGPAS